MDDLRNFEEAQLIRAKVNACFKVFISRPSGHQTKGLMLIPRWRIFLGLLPYLVSSNFNVLVQLVKRLCERINVRV